MPKPSDPLLYRDPPIRDQVGNTQVLTISLEERAVEVIEQFFREHDAELLERLAAVGVDWHAVAQPGWERFLQHADREKLFTLEKN